MTLGEVVQQLWSGYGVIQKVKLQYAEGITDAIAKHIDLSQVRANRRGWGGDVAHQRKVRSYQVETEFYESYAHRCTNNCRVAKLFAAEAQPNATGWILILEDLDSAEYSARRQEANTPDIHSCLSWLARFHATFLGESATGLWPIGTYWHLATRPDEFDAMPGGDLKSCAAQIDKHLNEAKYQTLVHGDAKIANFCFHKTEDSVAAVDFQYVGRGCGMKDVAYFISSCLSEREAAERQEELLGFYFAELRQAVNREEKGGEFASLEAEWRRLYPFAWADFCRFLSGWSPGHWKLNGYSNQITDSVLQDLLS